MLRRQYRAEIDLECWFVKHKAYPTPAAGEVTVHSESNVCIGTRKRRDGEDNQSIYVQSWIVRHMYQQFQQQALVAMNPDICTGRGLNFEMMLFQVACQHIQRPAMPHRTVALPNFQRRFFQKWCLT